MAIPRPELASLGASGHAPGVSLPIAALAAFGVLLFGASAASATNTASATRATHRPRPKAHRAAPRRATHKQTIPLQHAAGSRAEAYATLTPDACLAELSRRLIPFVNEAEKPGVKIPVRLNGKVGGVLYRTDFPDSERAHVPWEVFDCRLVLALDDFSETLRAHSVAEVRIFSAWRPPAKSWKVSDWARRHQGALAVDVRELRKDDGEVLNVLDHFHGKLGASQCTAGSAPASANQPEARELHEIVCRAAEAHIFNSILTPNYNPAHKNHFHLELTPGVDWFMLR